MQEISFINIARLYYIYKALHAAGRRWTLYESGWILNEEHLREAILILVLLYIFKKFFFYRPEERF